MSEKAKIIEKYYRQYFSNIKKKSIFTFLLDINDLNDDEKDILKYFIERNLCYRGLIHYCPNNIFTINTDLYNELLRKFVSHGNDLHSHGSRPSTAHITENIGGFYKQKVVKVIRKY